MAATIMFTLKTTDDNARRGELDLPHGTVQTPCFMPIATQGAFKGGISAQDIAETRAEIALGNTYHLHLKPGENVVEQLGGLQTFTNWHKPMLTDSGGFQVFSLGNINTINDEGVEFTNPANGDKIWLDAEKSMDIQHALGADIIMCFDECPAFQGDKQAIERAVMRTTAWAQRCRTHHQNLLKKSGKQQYLFGIVQGGVHQDLRKQSLNELKEIGFDGYALGGLAVGEPNEAMYATCDDIVPHMPENKPRYLMGVGTPIDLIECVTRGIDMFDCVLPTRNGRHGKLFTINGEMNITNEKFATDDSPLSEITHPLLTGISKGYLRHLFKAGEMLGSRLAAMHNVYFYQWLMQQMRDAIEEQRFVEWKADFLKQYLD